MASLLKGAAFPVLALVTLLIGIVLLIAAFASPYWFHTEHRYKGLWVYLECDDITSGQGCHRWPIESQVEDWFNAVRGLLVAGLALMLVVLVCIPAYIHAGKGQTYRTTMLAFAVMAFISGGCTIIGSIIFGFMSKASKDEEWNYSWCFFMGIVGGAMAIVACLILMAAACFKAPREDHKYKKFPDLYIDPYRPTVYTLTVDE